jgi:hypothetical protein
MILIYNKNYILTFTSMARPIKKEIVDEQIMSNEFIQNLEPKKEKDLSNYIYKALLNLIFIIMYIYNLVTILMYIYN